MKLFTLALVLVALAAPAAAQTPVIPVLGVGSLVLEVPLAPAAAQAQTYYAYVDARARQVLAVTCVLKTIGTAVSECATPLKSLGLTAQHTLAVTAAVVAADGELEGAKVALPFSLRLLGAPVAPTAASSSVRPVPPGSF